MKKKEIIFRALYVIVAVFYISICYCFLCRHSLKMIITGYINEINNIQVEKCLEDNELKYYSQYYLNLLPDNIMKKFNDDGWIIEFDDENKTKMIEYESNDSIGITINLHKKIIISPKKRHIDESLLHEIGHYVDFQSNYCSKNEKFLEIFEKEKDFYKKNKFVFCYYNGSYAKRNSEEYFAEMFQQYIMYPKITKLYAPMTCEYIEKVIEKIK